MALAAWRIVSAVITGPAITCLGHVSVPRDGEGDIVVKVISVVY